MKNRCSLGKIYNDKRLKIKDQAMKEILSKNTLLIAML